MGARRDLQDGLTLQFRNLDGPTEGRDRKLHGDCAGEVIAIALEELVVLDGDLDIKVARGAVATPCRTIITRAQAGARIHAGWNAEINRMVADHAAFAGAAATGLFNPFALAAARRANLTHLEETIRADHVPLPPTSRAAALFGARLGATAGTFLAGLVLPVSHLTADPSGRFFERQGDLMT